MTKQRCILITGGSKGIGYACCQSLELLGFTTVSLARTTPDKPLPSCTYYKVDLSDLHATEKTVKEVLSNHPISGLICNAGRGDIGSIDNFSTRQIQQSVTFNLIGPMCIARQCVPILRQQNRSDLIFIGSTSALTGARYGSLYSAAKFGLRGFAQAISHELAASNCHVGIVQPGMVRTEFFDTLDFEPGPLEAHALLASDIAQAVSSMLLSPDHALIRELLVEPRQHVVQKRKPQ